MVRGIGVDIIEIARIRHNIETRGEGFLQKIFTDQEIAYCGAMHHAEQHFAARFAAKEAVSKALSTGWSGEFRWKDVEVLNDPAGQPHIVLHGALRETLGRASILLSLSHSESHVVAMALIQDLTGSS
jgi:holo-[acyl-carrier protein] synthase